YSYRMTASDNLFSGIYLQSEGTNVPKPTMNEQSEVNYRRKKFFIQFIEIIDMDSQEAVLR
ncbi:11523_t:CDS:1, partial [Racocetra persica]